MIVNTMGHIQKLENLDQHQLLKQLSKFKEKVFFILLYAQNWTKWVKSHKNLLWRLLTKNGQDLTNYFDPSKGVSQVTEILENHFYVSLIGL